MEHRWGQRKAAHQSVRVATVGGDSAQGHVANVSISGALVKTPLPAPVLSIVQITFVTEKRRLRVSGTVAAQVVRRTPEGLGLEWCEQVPEIVDALTTTPASGDSLTIT